MVIWNVQKTLVASNTSVAMLLNKYKDRYTFIQKMKHIESKGESLEMIHYSQEELVVIEFTAQGLHIRKDSKVQGFSRGLLILFYYKGGGL